jgi:hypothetical protein
VTVSTAAATAVAADRAADTASRLAELCIVDSSLSYLLATEVAALGQFRYEADGTGEQRTDE